MQSVFVSKTLVRVHLSPLDQQSPTFLTLGTSFVEDNSSMDWGKGGWFGMIQARYVYCILHFCYYYINSISDHQALDPGGWGPLSLSRASQVVLEIEEPPCKSSRRKRCEFDHWVGKILWRRAWQPTPVFLPGDFHGQRSLVGYSPWSHKEPDTTEQLSTALKQPNSSSLDPR